MERRRLQGVQLGVDPVESHQILVGALLDDPSAVQHDDPVGVFVLYELYRATRTGSVLLPFLALLDLAIIVLIVREYRLLRREQTAA